MPELPEVETTLRGIAPHLQGRSIQHVTLRNTRLRWPVDESLPELLQGATIVHLQRRAKYLLLRCESEHLQGHLLIHLGMSGSLRVVPSDTPPKKHDHVDIGLDSGQCLRYHDPRRFGCILWTDEALDGHDLLAHLGPEPLSDAFHANYLNATARNRKTAVKAFLMDSRVVVGVGNIYANESLFKAGIHPRRAAGNISKARYETLVEIVKATLREAIEQGGTTLRDFVNADGKPGYFAQSLNVYGRAGEPCPTCGAPIKHDVIGQRATYYCACCQR